MKLSKSRPGRLIGAGAVALALSGAGTGVALAASGSPNPAPSTTARAHSQAAGKHLHSRGKHVPLMLRLMRRATHGEFVLNTKKGPQTVDFQRGVVTAVTPTSVTLTSRGGYAKAYTLATGSHIAAPHAKGTKATYQDVATKDRAIVVTAANGTTVRFLAAHPVRATAPSGSTSAS